MPKPRQEEPRECQYCGRRGHVEEDCFKKSAKEAKVLSTTDVQSKGTCGRNAWKKVWWVDIQVAD